MGQKRAMARKAIKYARIIGEVKDEKELYNTCC